MSETFYRLLFIFIDVILPLTIGYYFHKYKIISLNTCNFLLKLNIRFIMIITGLGSFWLIKIDQNLLTYVVIYYHVLMILKLQEQMKALNKKYQTMTVNQFPKKAYKQY